MKKIICLVLTMLFVLPLWGCGGGKISVAGTYEGFNGTRYVLKETAENRGTFEVYDIETGDKKYVNDRKTWELSEEGDLLTLHFGSDDVSFKVYKKYIVQRENGSEYNEPYLYGKTAPNGKTFYWEFGGYTFKSDGLLYQERIKYEVEGSTYYKRTYEEQVGEYRVKNNMIQIKKTDSVDFEDYLYIYDGDHIAYADDVYTKGW